MTDAGALGVPPHKGNAVVDERSLQLDLFRGVAAIFMIVNHSGYQLLKAEASSGGWPAGFVFLGSTAPALFFFATGVGSGFSSGGRERVASVSRKIVLLLLADMLLNWSAGTLLGLDFFGFAAVATLVLFLVKRARRPVLVAAFLLVLVVIARFGVVSFVRGSIAEDSVLAFITGIAPVRHVSYPLGPWLAFPLLGFLVGRRWRRGGVREETWTVSIASALLLGASAVLASRGAPVFRWGSVSIAYFLCAVGVVAVVWLVTRWLAKASPSFARSMALRGPASLLIVPLHYGALGMLEELSPPPWSLVAWVLTTVLLAICVLLLSRALVASARRFGSPGSIAEILIGGAACTVGLVACLHATPLVRLEVCSAAEVVIALLLLWSSRRNVVDTRTGPGGPLSISRDTSPPSR